MTDATAKQLLLQWQGVKADALGKSSICTIHFMPWKQAHVASHTAINCLKAWCVLQVPSMQSLSCLWYWMVNFCHHGRIKLPQSNQKASKYKEGRCYHTGLAQCYLQCHYVQRICLSTTSSNPGICIAGIGNMI